MKRITVFLLILLILVLGLDACQYSDKASVDPVEEPAVEVPVVEPQKPSMSKEEEAEAFEVLRSYLPLKEGFVWSYDGFAEYGHTMTIEQRFQREDSLQMMITGLADDMSGEMAESLLKLDLEYTVEDGQWKQKRNAPRMMGKDIVDMVLLRCPLEVGNAWDQEVRTVEGETLYLHAEIKAIDDKENIIVRYEDTGSDYYEERTFSKGLGITSFQSLFQADDENFEIGYFLNREISGYPFELQAQSWLPPMNVMMLYYGMAEYAHRATFTDVEYEKQGRIYTVEGDFEYDGSGIPGNFTLQYEVDGNRGSVTEHVLENTRLGENKINSKFKDLIILQLPLETGNSWSQKLIFEGEEKTMTATIMETKIAENGNTQIKVDYQVPAEGYHDGIYFERRTFEKGRGLVQFSLLLPGELSLEGKEWDDPQKVEQAIDNQQFGYSQNPIM